MKNENFQNKWRESVWRRKLTDAERAELRADPELAAELDLESRLSDLLAKVPKAPVSSNFTARVLQAVEREETRRPGSRSWNWHVLLPRFAAGTAALLLAGLALHQHEMNVHRAALARNVALVAGANLPSVEALKNFDAIRRMSQPRADEELLALMQ
jgi:anti-sigma factor RsiW